MKKVLDYLRANQTQIQRGVIVLWGIYFFGIIILELIYLNAHYSDWRISEWMINYEGGFVRRGLIGQLLYECYKLSPYPLIDVVMVVSFATFLTLVVLVIKLFLKEGWSCVLLFAPYLFFIAFRSQLFWTRRDHIALLITWAIFWCYSRCINNHKTGFMIIMQILSIFTLLMHEASFFFTFPILFFHYYGYKRSQLKSVYESIVSTICFSLPIMITMAVVCLNKGNTNIANAIWISWQSCMERFSDGGDITKIGVGVLALTWDSVDTFIMHFKLNWCVVYNKFFPAFPITLFNIVAIYYLVTRLNTVDLKWNKLRKMNRTVLSNIMLIQFFCLIPMFTILSCDMARIITYWVISTLFAYHFFKNSKLLSISWLSRLSETIQIKIDRVKFLSYSWVYFGILFCLPIQAWGVISIGDFYPITMISDIIYYFCLLYNYVII